MMDTALFVAAKLAGAALRIETWLLLTMGLGLVAITRKRWQAAMGLCGASFAVMLGLTVLPVGDLLLEQIERAYPRAPALTRLDGIIVLGGGEDAPATRYWQQIQLGEGGERYTAALALARRYPEAKVLFTGGSGVLRGGLSEATIAARFFKEQGLASDRLLLEGTSRNTRENARISLALAKPELGESWVLVTSAFLMPRAMQTFADAGWPSLIAYPVDYRAWDFDDGIGWELPRNIRNLNIATKEWASALVRSVS